MIRAAFVLLLTLITFCALGQSVNWSQGVVYEYDGSGNVKKIGTDAYVYDTAQRLIRGTVTGSQQSYSYDSFGNRTACQSGGGADCQYGFTINSATNRIAGRTYDKRGNMQQLPEGNTLDYDELGMVRKETGSNRAVYYIYTADDERIAVYDADTQLGTHTWRWTIRGLDKKPLRELTSEGTSGTVNFKWAKDHIWREGALLASRQLDATTPGGVSTYHYHTDHLGTPRQVTNSSAAIIGRHDYLPFGPELPGNPNEPQQQNLKFTGHERDAARDHPPLDYMHARYYEPRLGRFLSVDPVWESADLGRPQTWNRYTYVENNPINKIDPDGKCAFPGACPEPARKDREDMLARQMLPTLPIVLDPHGRPLETLANVLMIAALVTPFSGDDIIARGAVRLVQTEAAESAAGATRASRGTAPRVKKMSSDADAVGPHTSFKKSAETDRVSGYETYDGNGNPIVRFRGEGIPHGGVEPPVILEPKPGKGPGAKPKVPRKPKDDELPKGYAPDK